MKNNYNDIRNSFKNFFKNSGHAVIPSANLVPNDATLLFTNSGMVQFKDIFTGAESTNLKRATTVQKCIRAGGKHNDLENVGHTNRHHTFFEMLGNFSFGDYFKEEAIFFAWEFLTKELGISKEKLYTTVFHEDGEAFNIWQKLTGFGEDKILKIKTNDNFWSMGPIGPCGPCSEIFYDYGDKVFGGKPGTPDESGPRYTEIWNLVFMQFNQIDENTRIPLGRKGIDTGMGLERLVSVIENKTDNYDTSLFREIIDFSKNLIKADELTYRILADHARSAAFLMAEGVLPTSDGRGYVLRRIIRRALRYIYMAGYSRGGIFEKVTYKIVELMGQAYPELIENRNIISQYSLNEEEKFMTTLPNGMRFLQREMSFFNSENQQLSGKKAFTLYDTFGFPLDITNDILISNKFSPVKEEDFENEMLEQKKRSKENWKGTGDIKINDFLITFASSFPETIFEGYESLESTSTVLGIFELEDGGYLVLDKTCFYPEGGGQEGDAGLINDVPVLNTIKIKGCILHKIASISGFKKGEKVILKVDKKERMECQNAHSATHLLHHVLRRKFGEAVMQKGSLVSRNRLRFDFSFNAPLTHAQIKEIELEVNKIITSGETSLAKEQTIEEAKKDGAIAFFGEKYGEKVRVMTIGESKELCGGTHVGKVNEIGAFKIVSESLVASGIRRIEALTGLKAIEYMLYASNNLEYLRLSSKLSRAASLDQDLSFRKEEIISEWEKLKSEVLLMRKKITDLSIENAIQKEGLNHENFYIKCVFGLNADAGTQVMKLLKGKGEVIILLAFNEEGIGTLLVSSVNLNLKANEIAQKIGSKLNAKGGGGKPDFATMGGIILQNKIGEKDIISLL